MNVSIGLMGYIIYRIFIVMLYLIKKKIIIIEALLLATPVEPMSKIMPSLQESTHICSLWIMKLLKSSKLW